MSKKKSRKLFILGAVIMVGATLAFAFWPRPMMVDIGKVQRGHMTVTIDEEGRTRVHDVFVVSSPVAGLLLRVDIEPGDQVFAGESVIGNMRPSNPTPLDIRNKAQARARLSAARAALRLANAERERAVADKELADLQLQRMRSLVLSNSTSQLDLDRAEREARTASASLQIAVASIAVKEADLVNARANLISFGDERPASAAASAVIPIYAPVTGRVLRIMQESETILPAGAPLMEIGNIEGDLEVVVELLSSDAVQVSPGDKAALVNWGGFEILEGVVKRVDPLGFTKVSALGVEEQRVDTIIEFTDPPPKALRKLGHGFRVEVQIVIWEDENALIVPSSALFRDGQDWTVFVIIDGIATLRQVKIGRNNGVDAQVIAGLQSGDKVVLYPSSGLNNGVKVSKREIK